LIGLGFSWGGVKLGIGPVNNPGPGFFPLVIGGVLSLLSITLFIRTLWADIGRESKITFWKEKRSWEKVLFSLLALIFYLIFLNYLGYLLTTFLFIIYLLKFIGKKGWLTSVLMAILIAASSYALFQMGLGVSLPKGLIKIG
jgi:putative tricarboxylic transport membrane protein